MFINIHQIMIEFKATSTCSSELLNAFVRKVKSLWCVLNEVLGPGPWRSSPAKGRAETAAVSPMWLVVQERLLPAVLCWYDLTENQTNNLRVWTNNGPMTQPGGTPDTQLLREIKVILNISFHSPAFLYQEYRDTSKQQEIEQRRQQENLLPGFRSEVEAPGSTITSPPVVQLQLRNSARSLSLWQNLEVVQQSGLLATLSQKEIIMQEVSVCVQLKGTLPDREFYFEIKLNK